MAARQLVAPGVLVYRLDDVGWDGRGDMGGANGLVDRARRLKTWWRQRLMVGIGDSVAFLLRLVFGNYGRSRCQVHDQVLAGPQRYFARRNRATNHHVTLPE